jgi:hypothetical protein
MVRDQKAGLKKQGSELEAEYDHLCNLAIEMLKRDGITSIKTDLGKIVVKKRFSVKKPQGEDMIKFLDYLKSTGHYEGMRTVDSRTLNAWYSEQLENAKARGDIDWHPPGLGLPSFEDYISLEK